MRALACAVVVLVALTAAGCSLFSGSSSADSVPRARLPACGSARRVGCAGVGRGAPRRDPARHCPRPPSTPATSSTRPPRCGTPGPPTTPTPRAYFVKEKLTPTTCRRRGRSSDQLRRVPRPRCTATRWPPALQETLRRARRDHAIALLRQRLSSTTEGDSPAALGNRIAAADHRLRAAPTARTSRATTPTRATRRSNPPLVVAEPGTAMADPNRWQPLALAQTSPRTASRSRRGPDVHRAALGPRDAASRSPASGRRTDRPGPPPPVGDPRPTGVQARARRHHPRQQPARPGGRRRRSTSRPARSATTRSARTTARATR